MTRKLRLVPAASLPQGKLAALAALDPTLVDLEAAARGKDAAYFQVAKDSDDDDDDAYGFVKGSLLEPGADGETQLRLEKVAAREESRDLDLPRKMVRRYLDMVARGLEDGARVSRVLVTAHDEDDAKLYEECGFRPQVEDQDRDRDVENLVLELRKTRIACANAFNNPDKSFSGNPAAICVLPFKTRSLGTAATSDSETLEEAPSCAFVNEEGEIEGTEDPCEVFMKMVGTQMNLSETAFLRDLGAASETRDDGRTTKTHRFEIRWKTPDGEVDLCGHATQASAFALWEPKTQLLPPGTLDGVDTLVLESRSGELRARRDASGAILLDFPLETISKDLAASDAERAAVIRGLEGVDPSQIVFVGRNRMDLVVEFDNRDAVAQVVPNSALLARIPCRAISISALEDADRPHDFVSRLFAPALGVEEDPFCGSAHCYLGPHYGRRLGKTEMRALMLSKRTGVTEVKVNHDTQRVVLRGRAELSWVGELHSGPFQA